MKRERKQLLEEALSSGKYIIDLEKGEMLYKNTGGKVGGTISRGYRLVSLYLKKPGAKRHVYNYGLHEVIAFVGGLCLDVGLTVNHIDGNKKNNSLSNLESISHADNMKHGHRLGLIPNGPGLKRKITDSQIEEMRELKLVGQTVNDIAAMYGTNRAYAGQLINGRVRFVERDA